MIQKGVSPLIQKRDSPNGFFRSRRRTRETAMRKRRTYFPAIISWKAYSVAFLPMGIMTEAITSGSSVFR